MKDYQKKLLIFMMISGTCVAQGRVDAPIVVLSKNCEACQDLLENLRSCPQKAEKIQWYSLDAPKQMQSLIMRFPYLRNIRLATIEQKKTWSLKGTPTLIRGELGAEVFQLGSFGCCEL